MKINQGRLPLHFETMETGLRHLKKVHGKIHSKDFKQIQTDLLQEAKEIEAIVKGKTVEPGKPGFILYCKIREATPKKRSEILNRVQSIKRQIGAIK